MSATLPEALRMDALIFPIFTCSAFSRLDLLTMGEWNVVMHVLSGDALDSLFLWIILNVTYYKTCRVQHSSTMMELIFMRSVNISKRASV